MLPAVKVTGAGGAFVRTAAVLSLLILLAAGCGRGAQPAALGCAVGTSAKTALTLDGEQAVNAATIAAVGRRLGLPDHAVTVALATAIQESGLHNLRTGDRDSLGLFQQRPSQGWGQPSAILIPRRAAAAFYARLRKVQGWQRLSVNDAAQAVQHSGQPTAYAQWEDQARVLAQVFSGEVPAGIRCTVPRSRVRLDGSAVRALAQQELGARGLQQASAAGAWSAAAWLVAHADTLHVRTVAVRGRQWSARTGAWSPVAAPMPGLTYS